jgi:hypothetical protein
LTGCPYRVGRCVISGTTASASWGRLSGKLEGRWLQFSEVGGEAGDKFIWGRTWIKID